MKIGIDVREFERGKHTGIGRYLLDFLNWVIDNDKKNLYILFGNQKTEIPKNILNAKNIKFIRKKEIITILWDQIILPFLAIREKVDIFFSPYFKGPLLLGKKMIISINDATPLILPVNFFKKMYYLYFGRFCAKFAKKVFTLSYDAKEKISKLMKIPKEKIKVIHLAVDKKFKVLPEEKTKKVLEKYGINFEYILYLGGLKPHKNVESLVEAYLLLPEEIKKRYKLLIIGRISDFLVQKLKILSKKYNFKKLDNVHFLDYVTDEDLPMFFNGAFLFVFPSLCEGFGLPPLEAMACGVPVICSNKASLPEVVGDAAIICEPTPENIKDAIEKIFEDRELYEKLKQKGIANAKRFTVDKMSKKILDFLIS